MKRYGYLIEKIIDKNNLEESFRAVMRGKKHTRTINHLYKTRDKLLKDISSEIEKGAYAPSKYREFEVNENGKIREIQSLPFKDRIALHAVMNIIDEIFTPKLIRDTYASIAGRGIHDGLRRVRTALKDRSNTAYCLKIDIKKFYHSVDQDVLIKMLASRIKDQRLMQILINIIRSYNKGLPIGYHSSQMLGNFYLSKLDYYIKYTLGVKYYFRYCDDIVILSQSKSNLHHIFKRMKNLIESDLHLTIKKNYQIFPVEARGIDFLGYVIRHDYVLIRKRIKVRAARKLQKIKSKKRKRIVISSLWGWAKHCDSRNLFYKLTKMKSFKELNVRYKPADGKKRFEGNLTPLGQLQNCEITVIDFETDIKTKEGDGRYVIQFSQNSYKGKFITNSEEMKNILDQIREVNGLPFTTTIKRETFGQNKTKYIFA